MANLKGFDIEVIADGESQAIEIGAVDEADARAQVARQFGDEATILSLEETGDFDADPEFDETDEDADEDEDD